MRNVFLFLCVCLSVCADWGQSDSMELSGIRTNTQTIISKTTDLYNVNSGIYNELMDFKTGYQNSPAGYHMGWRQYFKESYKAQNELADAKEYNFRTVDGQETIHLVEVNPFSDRNKTLFSQDDLANDETQYYQDYIFSFYPQIYNHTWPNDKPDSSFLSAPASGDMMNRITPEMDNNNLGINAIANSEQTSQIRSSLTLAENSLDSMFNSQSYSNSVISWDFSAIGQIFVDRHIMLNNPFSNLKGQFRLVPNQQDFHYSVWYNYFREGSTYGNLIRTCANAFMFFMVLLYVVNDLMSIVDA